MSLKVGIVGLPNVGKSTLFNALLKRQQAVVANYPFATIEPNVGIVEVPDERLVKLSEVVHTNRIVQATVEFVDIAGLVKGAAQGAGLGNKFLAHIREVDVIVVVVRDFSDSEVVREGSVNPESDYQTIEAELILKDLETVLKMREAKALREKGMEKKKEVVEKLYRELNEGKSAREIVLEEEEKELVYDLFLLTAKPEIRVLNVGETDLRLKETASNSSEVIICAKMEAELASLSVEEGKAYLAEYGIKESGLDKLIRRSYETLGLMSFLTAGEIEARAWTVKKGTKAPQAAGVIHTDFEKKFIKAKICSFEDFVDSGGWKGASDKGKVRLEGAEYVVREGDVIEFMIGR